MSLHIPDLIKLLSLATPEEAAQLDALLEPEIKPLWQPDPRNPPQVAAYVSQADILLYGGEVGGGKTDLLVGLALTQHRNSVIFRREAEDVRNIEDRIIEVCGREGWNGTLKVLRRDAVKIELAHLSKPGSERSWQGRPHDLYGFDEGAQLSREKVQFVIGWNRSVISGQRCRVVIASNPPMGGEGEWVIEWFAPWVDPKFARPAKQGELRWAVTGFDKEATTIWVPSGDHLFFETDRQYRLATPQEIEERHPRVVKPLTRTFIRSRLDNNPYLAKTDYRAKLQNLRPEIRRALLDGDFLAMRKDHEWQIIPTDWVKRAQARWTETPPKGARMEAIGVDVAQGGADDTVLAPRYRRGSDPLIWFAPLVEVPGAETPLPSDTAALVVRERRHNALVVIDVGGGYGSGPKERLKENKCDVTGFDGGRKTEARSREGDHGFVNMRAWAWWRFYEALNPDNAPDEPRIALPPDPRILAELTAVRYKMRGTDIQVESKEELKKSDRLGRSPDRADAIVMSWASGERALALRAQTQIIEARKQEAWIAPPPEYPQGSAWMAG